MTSLALQTGTRSLTEALLLALSRRRGMSQVQAQTKDLALLWRFAQPPLPYRRPKRILAIRERTPPSVWFGDRVQLPAEVSWGDRITPRGFAGKPQMSDEPSCLFVSIRG